MNSIHVQKEFFASGATLDVEYRIRQLRSLYYIIGMYQQQICDALHQDLGKSREEAYATEVGMVLSQIRYTLKHIRRWARPRRVKTTLSQFKSKGMVVAEPYGVCLILSNWNYPFLLSIGPAVSAIAAGNCVIIKPSVHAPATGELLSQIFNQNFEQRFCRVITGGTEVAKSLLLQRFDSIFFTGSVKHAQEVITQAAENLVPVTMVLGGKSPCIVDDTAVIPIAARRIIWGKTLNSGQSGSAPDYLLVHRKVYRQLLEAMKGCITEFYGEHPEHCPTYPRIANQQQYQRLCQLMEGCELLYGGEVNPEELKIAPALIAQPEPGHPLLTEEIFGPLLPILVYDEIDEVIQYLKERPAPLALYLFTRDSRVERQVMSSLQFGGGCVNDTMLQMAGEAMPIGGVSESGFGAFRGKAGFDSFSHEKSILRSSSVLDFGLRYPPYDSSPRKGRVIRWLLRHNR